MHNALSFLYTLTSLFFSFREIYGKFKQISFYSRRAVVAQITIFVIDEVVAAISFSLKRHKVYPLAKLPAHLVRRIYQRRM